MAGGATAEQATLAGLQADLAALRQGLGLMLETQAVHSELLRQLLVAAAAPAEAEGPLADSLAEIAGLLARQGDSLAALQGQLAGLPREVGDSVAHGVRDALRG